MTAIRSGLHSGSRNQGQYRHLQCREPCFVQLDPPFLWQTEGRGFLQLLVTLLILGDLVLHLVHNFQDLAQQPEFYLRQIRVAKVYQ